jgi:hypothetical protein
MIELLETPINPYFLLDEVDVIFDNTPVSPEDMERITEMIRQLKAQSKDNLYLEIREKKEEDAVPIKVFAAKEQSLRRRRELYAARKAQKIVATEGC